MGGNGRMSKRAEKEKLMNIPTPLPIYCMDGFYVVGCRWGLREVCRKTFFWCFPWWSPMAGKCKGQLGLRKSGLGLTVWGDGLFEVVWSCWAGRGMSIVFQWWVHGNGQQKSQMEKIGVGQERKNIKGQAVGGWAKEQKEKSWWIFHTPAYILPGWFLCCWMSVRFERSV